MQARTKKLAIAALWLVGGGGTTSFAFQTRSLTCTRELGASARCTFAVSRPFAYAVEFPPGSVSSVEVFERTSGKGNTHHTFGVTLLDQRGAETELTRYAERAQAEAERDELSAFFADPRRPSYALAETSGIGAYLYFFGALGVGAFLLVRALRTPRGVTPAHSPASAATPANTTPGWHPPRLLAWFYQPGPKPLLYFFGGVVAIAAVAQFIATSYADAHQGWVELNAAARCRFQGAELLPGGSMRMALEPGSYAIEVYDPSVASRWETQHFDVRRGETTHVPCRPSSSGSKR